MDIAFLINVVLPGLIKAAGTVAGIIKDIRAGQMTEAEAAAAWQAVRKDFNDAVDNWNAVGQ